MYDLEKDPGEKDNLILKFPQIAKAMHKELKQILPPFKSFQKEQKELEIDKATIEGLRALGYVN